MSSSRDKLLLKRQSPLLDVPETMELTAPSPSSSPQESPNAGENRREIAVQRRPRQSIDGVQVYRDLVNSKSFMEGNKCSREPNQSISMISDPSNTGGDPSSTSKGGNNNNSSKKNGWAKIAWRSKRSKGSLSDVENNGQTKKEKRRASCADRPGTLSLTSLSSSPSLSSTMPPKSGSYPVGLKMKLRAIGKFSTLENMCKNKTVSKDLDDPMNNGDVCLMEHNPNRILKVSWFSTNT
ncbi:hypothetical protein ElyMa_005367100 [Elysia marginata]|uniref:Uncharacterized protein n=1 Tax=Elysia marginata TaxID=1093978 RepID=A0AAV4ECZ2_9GAST|nr:hypothetical protein ElyMa_005367100 [Elysia marginata]